MRVIFLALVAVIAAFPLIPTLAHDCGDPDCVCDALTLPRFSGHGVR